MEKESDAEHIEPERDIAALLAKHAALLSEVKAAMAKELDPAVHDDIFLLRYILSYKTLDKVDLAASLPPSLSGAFPVPVPSWRSGSGTCLPCHVDQCHDGASFFFSEFFEEREPRRKCGTGKEAQTVRHTSVVALK